MRQLAQRPLGAVGPLPGAALLLALTLAAPSLCAASEKTPATPAPTTTVAAPKPSPQTPKSEDQTSVSGQPQKDAPKAEVPAASPPPNAASKPPPTAVAPAAPGAPAATPPGSKPPVARKDPVAAPAAQQRCQQLDAGNDPRCDQQRNRIGGGVGDPGADQPRPTPAPAPSPAPGQTPPSATAPPAGQPHHVDAACAPGAQKGGKAPCPSGRPPFWAALSGKAALPLLLIAGAIAALLIAVLAWSLLRRGQGARPRATPPTPLRRDLLLTDERGRGWRIAGVNLTPGVTLGSDSRSQGFLDGDGIARRHAEAWVQDGRLLVRAVAGQQLFFNDRLLPDTTAEIASTGDRLRLGRSEFTITID